MRTGYRARGLPVKINAPATEHVGRKQDGLIVRGGPVRRNYPDVTVAVD